MTGFAIALAAIWAAAGLVLVARGPLRAGVQVLGGSAVGAVALWATHVDASVAPLLAWLVPAAVAAVALGLPDGRVNGSSRALFAAALGAVAVAIGVGYTVADRVPTALEIGGASVAAVAFVAPSVRLRAPEVPVVDRPRLQLVAGGVAAAAALTLVAGALALATDNEIATACVWLAFGLPAVALAAGCFAGARRTAGVVVSFATAAVSFALVLVAGQCAALLLAGHLPDEDDRELVAASFFAASVATLAFAPARRAGAAFTSRWVLGVRRPPEDAARVMTERASEGVPLEELLLQLAESLRDALGASRVEVWTRPAAWFERAVSVPDRPGAAVECTLDELVALSRVSVAGDTWLRTWVPRLHAGRDERQVRLAPAVHTGTVLGFVLVERFDEDARFSDEDDRALAEVGRRLGEVLHARRLDAALTATLDDLRASRSRLVAAADAERRRIERNLHDGAQQHLVALAVSLRLARDLVRDDPEASADILEQLTEDVRDTIQQLRDLAHGIYPPLLVDLGLTEALRAAAQRSPLPVSLDVSAGRYPSDVEAAVYFCCLEALQNAAKHAPDARVEIRLWEHDGLLRFEIVDDGPGFVPDQTRMGHGFQNMADRLGAIGGRVEWASAPGRGTRVMGEVRA